MFSFSRDFRVLPCLKLSEATFSRHSFASGLELGFYSLCPALVDLHRKFKIKIRTRHNADVQV